MSITLEFKCGGCLVKAKGTKTLNPARALRGGWIAEGEAAKAQDAAPEGWIAFDPWTHCTYCPACWDYVRGAGETEEEESKEGVVR